MRADIKGRIRNENTGLLNLRKLPKQSVLRPRLGVGGGGGALFEDCSAVSEGIYSKVLSKQTILLCRRLPLEADGEGRDEQE
jgi:hypothetical protein